MSATDATPERRTTTPEGVTVIPGPHGPWRLDVLAGEWWWSDDIFRVLGFEPGQVVPSIELLEAHQHPEDRPVVMALWRNAVANGEPFAFWHRIVDARKRVRNVVTTGAGEQDGDGRVVRMHGFFIDVTDAKRRQTAREVDEAVRRSALTRGTIEQAKGIIMASVGLSPGEAFEALRRSSQHRNVKLRTVAEELVDGVVRRGLVGEAARALVLAELGEGALAEQDGV